MYGGLFGDLPAATKKDGSGKGGDDDPADNGKESASKNQASTAAVPADSYTNTFLKPAKPAPKPSLFVPPATRKPKPAGASSQILEAVGSAGTSMAFIPTTLTKRKKPNRFTKMLQTPKAVAPLTTTTKTTTSSSPAPTLDKHAPTTTNATAVASAASASTTAPPPLVATTTTVTTTSASSKSHQQQQYQVRNIHEETTNQSSQVFTPPPPLPDTMDPAAIDIDPPHEHMNHEMDEVTDPYDPYVPNDLLQYRERQALAKERAALERETREALEKQRLLRQQLEREREELQRKGDYQQLQKQQQQQQQQHTGQGRGRGRGVSNLPAWLVEKQRKEREDGLGSK